ncbi:MAG: helicase-associated domain-containing protein [Kineosporiaceae bacterium]
MSPSPASPPPVRSLADDLRARATEDLVRLMRARPDLAVPVPADIATLAARATTRAGVARALDRLTAPQLQVAEVLAVLPEPTSPDEVARLWGADAAGVLGELHDLALTWAGSDGLRLVRMARDLLGPFPAGLGPPLAEALDRRSPTALAELGARLEVAPTGDPTTLLSRVAEVLGDAARLGELLDRGPADAARIVDRLAWGPPVGSTTGAAPPAVAWLLRHGVLAAADEGRVLLPREVALARRGGRVHRAPAVAAPSPAGGPGRDPASVDRTAAGAGAEAVRLVAQLLGVLDRQRVAVLRTGGLGVREQRRLAAQLGVTDDLSALVCETAFAAGLVVDDGEAEPSFVPTGAADDWLESDTADRWATLAAGWLASARLAGLVGTRDQAGAVRAAWSDGVERPASRELRSQVVAVLATADRRVGVPATAVLEHLTHLAPRRAGPARDDLVRELLTEAAWLGLTSHDSLAAPGRALAADPGDPGVAAAALRALLPAPVARVVLQGDLTAVAPGPLAGWLETEMGLLADVESRGAATVYRFSAASVRRALDSGRDAEELLALLDRASGSAVPQPLAYLVRDVARRHGVLRVGAVGSYVRSDDEAALAELLADRRAAGLGLRRIAPTVLVAEPDPATLLRALRGLGTAPVPEGDGSVAAGPVPPRRRPAAQRRPDPDPAPDPRRLAEAVERWRLAETGPRPGSAELPRMDPAVSLSVLRQAVETGARVWIGYVDETGRATQRLVAPIGLQAGRLTAEEVGRAGPRLFSVHRVTGAAVAEPGSGQGATDVTPRPA